MLSNKHFPSRTGRQYANQLKYANATVYNYSKWLLKTITVKSYQNSSAYWSFCEIKLFFSKLTELITSIFLNKYVNIKCKRLYRTLLVEMRFWYHAGPLIL